MSGRRVRRPGLAAAAGALAAVLLAGVLFCGCTASRRQCTGVLEPVNGPPRSAAPDERDEP